MVESDKWNRFAVMPCNNLSCVVWLGEEPVG